VWPFLPAVNRSEGHFAAGAESSAMADAARLAQAKLGLEADRVLEFKLQIPGYNGTTLYKEICP